MRSAPSPKKDSLDMVRVEIPLIETDLSAQEILNIEFPLKFVDGSNVPLSNLKAFLYNEVTRTLFITFIFFLLFFFF